MRVEKQDIGLSVSNFDDIIMGTRKQKQKKHGPLLPDSIRCLVSGPSSSGKTNAVFNLIFDPNGLRFESIYVFSKSLYQDKYQFLAKAIPKEIGYYAFDENASVIHPSKAKKNSIMIFDDIACEKHDNIRNFFTMGRHNNIDTFYLGQTYSHIPKQLVRDNANLLILFKQDDTNLKHVHRDHVTTDMSFDKFKGLCCLAWKNEYGFIVIDKTSGIDKGRYRVGFDHFIVDLHDDQNISV